MFWLVGWSTITGFVLGAYLRTLARSGVTAWTELIRWGALALVVGVFALPFRGSTGIGAGDSYWYATMLADFVTQVRQGEFPVWAGQSEFAFNGAVFPLRIAPYFQHLGALLDLGTGRQLTPIQLRNLVVVTNFVLAAISCYACLNALSRGRSRWTATGLTCLFVASPGFLAPLYSGDQYMSFLAMPFLPPLFLGWQRWSEGSRRSGELLIACSLSATWWSHTPVALWVTLVSVLYLIIELLLRRRWKDDLLSGLRVGTIILILGAYPAASIAVIDNKIEGLGTVEAVMIELVRYRWDALLPFGEETWGLSTYQLGFGCAGLLLIVTVQPFLRRSRYIAIGVILLWYLLVLAFPLPGITRALWELFPQTVIGISNVWPQQRLYPIATVMVICLLASACTTLRPRARALLLGFLAVGFAWTLQQGLLLRTRLERTRADPATTEKGLRAENVMLTRYSYASFQDPPSYFSHGYMDPLMENRLLKADGSVIVAANAEAAAPKVLAGKAPTLVSEGVLTVSINERNTAFQFAPRLTVNPATHYALRLEFNRPTSGYLTIVGQYFYRDYSLPDSGFGLHSKQPPAAFGSGPTNSRVIAFRSDPAAVDYLSFSYFPKEPCEELELRYALFRVEPESLPVKVTSLVPYRARVEAGEKVILETPRVWYSGWKAVVNGKVVTTVKTVQNLVGVPLEAGKSEVTLRHVPPLWLRFHYALSLVAWVAIFIFASVTMARHLTPSTPLSPKH